MAKKKSQKKSKNVFESTWSATVEALAAAEAEIQRQLKVLMKKKGTKEAQEVLRNLASRVERERKRALQDLGSRARGLQARLEKERKALGRLVRESVESALASLNIPTRAEVTNLTRKVEELSRKIEARRKR
jgi:hypothetical protein